MSKAEMRTLDWDSCDIIIVTGDAYIDHPSFGMAVIGRTLEAQGFRVGIISQPNWKSADDFRGTAIMRNSMPAGFSEIDSTELDTPGR